MAISVLNPSLSAAGAHINVALSDFSTMLENAEKDFIWREIGSVKDVEKETDSFYKWDETSLTVEDGLRAPGAPLNAVLANHTTGNYVVQQYNFAYQVADEVRRNADQALDPDLAATRIVQQKMQLRRETDAAALYFGTGNFANTASLVTNTLWSSTASNPIKAIHAQMRNVKLRTLGAYDDMVLILGAAVWEHLINHPKVRERIQYVKTTAADAMFNLATLESIIGVRRVLVAVAGKNGSILGATATLSHVWKQTSASLVLAPKTLGLGIQTFGTMFRQKGAQIVTKIRSDLTLSDWVTQFDAYQYKSINTGAGYHWKTASGS